MYLFFLIISIKGVGSNFKKKYQVLNFLFWLFRLFVIPDRDDVLHYIVYNLADTDTSETPPQPHISSAQEQYDPTSLRTSHSGLPLPHLILKFTPCFVYTCRSTCIFKLIFLFHSSTIRYTATIHYSLPLLGSCCRTQPFYLFIYFL